MARRLQVIACPTCGDELESLLAACWKPACLAADIAEDQKWVRGDDQ